MTTYRSDPRESLPKTPAQEHLEHLLDQGMSWPGVLALYREAAALSGVARRPKADWKTVLAGFEDIHSKLRRGKHVAHG
jgi:hypothetical protein